MITTITSHRKNLLRGGAALAVALVTGCSMPAASAQRDEAAWSALKERTAWIILGHLAAKDGTWATLPAYDIVGRSITGDPRMPGVTDILRLTHEKPLYIRDFQNSGERRRLEWPGGRPLDDADLTGGVLAPGAHVIVKDLRRDTGSTCDTLCTVWALVGPSQAR